MDFGILVNVCNLIREVIDIHDRNQKRTEKFEAQVHNNQDPWATILFKHATHTSDFPRFKSN